MRRGRIFLFLFLILLIGGFLIIYALRNVLLPAPAATPTPTWVKVFIVKQPVPYGGTITEDVLETISLPPDRVVANMFTESEKENLVGKVARYPLDQGVPITDAMVAESVGELAPTGPTYTATIPPGMNAISLPISRLAAVSYGVADNAHVNVIACALFKEVDPEFQSASPNKLGSLQRPGVDKDGNVVLVPVTLGGVDTKGRLEPEPAFDNRYPWYVIPGEPQRPRATCQMFLQDIVVMKLGNFTDFAAQPQEQPGQPTPTPSAATQPPDVITLIVTPQDAVSLTWMLYNNFKFTLTLRNSTDNSRVAVEAATLQYILSQYNFPVPAKLPFAVEPRVDELKPPALPNDVYTVPQK